MIVNNAYLWLEKYANKSETSQVVLVKIQSQLEAVGVTFEEEHWLDILDLGISRGWGKPQGSGWGSPISDPSTPLPKPQAPPVTRVNLFLHTLRVVQL